MNQNQTGKQGELAAVKNGGLEAKRSRSLGADVDVCAAVLFQLGSASRSRNL